MIPFDEDCPYPDPKDGDLVTEDYRQWYRDLDRELVPVLLVAEGEDWREAVKAYMDREQIQANLWRLTEQDECEPLSLTTDNGQRTTDKEK